MKKKELLKDVEYVLNEANRLDPAFNEKIKPFLLEKTRHMDKETAKWCYLPMGIASSSWMLMEEKPKLDHLASPSAILTASETWKATSTIYEINKELEENLTITEYLESIPTDVFNNLPVYCPYIAIPENSKGLKGFFVHLEAEFNDQEELSKELRFLMLHEKSDGAVMLSSYYIKINDESINLKSELTHQFETYSPALEHLLSHQPEDNEQNITKENLLSAAIQVQIDSLKVALPLTLYLCSVDTDIELRESGSKRKRRNISSPQTPHIYDVGFRLGAALSKIRYEQSDDKSDSIGIKKVPHVRRAHWHKYWVGSRNSPERKQILKWLPPMYINVEGEDILRPTIKEVQ